MEPKACARRPRKPPPSFNAQAFLETAGLDRHIVQYGAGSAIFAQGDPCGHVLYMQSGSVKLSVLSPAGREAVVAMLGPGDFFGEGGLAGQPLRAGSASAVTPSTILLIDTNKMAGLLHEHHGMSDRFIAYLLSRNRRIEADLTDQLFNWSDKRLARALLLLARSAGTQDTPVRVVSMLSQSTLAKMIGTTRSRANFLLNKFKRLGFIEYQRDSPLTIYRSRLSGVLDD
jgi:CRP-like cAMP-binding protein